MLLLWDIDGTLLTTARSGIGAWEEALHELTGVRTDLSTFDTAGHPDYLIAGRLLTERAGTDSAGALVASLVRRYEQLLPAALRRREGGVLPNVRSILEHLESQPSVRSMLLTGNTRRGAAAKLAHYGLDRFFEEGAFSDAPCERGEIARAAMAVARARGWASEGSGVVVIGDTPHDVHCGRSIGARTIAVATGAYDAAALRRHQPWLVLQQLPPAEAFLRLISGAEVPTDV